MELYFITLPLQVLTGVIPDGFTELQSQLIASNPKLKTTSFPFTHLLPESRSRGDFKSIIGEKSVSCLLDGRSASTPSMSESNLVIEIVFI